MIPKLIGMHSADFIVHKTALTLFIILSYSSLGAENWRLPVLVPSLRWSPHVNWATISQLSLFGFSASVVPQPC